MQLPRVRNGPLVGTLISVTIGAPHDGAWRRRVLSTRPTVFAVMGVRIPLKVVDADMSLATIHRADICAVETAKIGERLL